MAAIKQAVDQASGSTTHIDDGGIDGSVGGIDHPQRLRRVDFEPAPRRLPLAVGIIPMRTQFVFDHKASLHTYPVTGGTTKGHTHRRGMVPSTRFVSQTSSPIKPRTSATYRNTGPSEGLCSLHTRVSVTTLTFQSPRSSVVS